MTHPITLRLQRRAGRAARDGRPLRDRVQAAFLGRDEFLAAVTGCPESTQSAEEVVSSRLKAG